MTAMKVEASSPQKSTLAKRSFRSELEFIICVLGIYSCYLYYGVLQERIYNTSHGPTGARFSFSALLLTAQTFTNALVARIVLLLFGKRTTGAGGLHSVPFIEYALVSSSYLLAMLFSFTALAHMSYPMQALGKSCKMIPVMLMGIVIRGRRYPPRDFACVLLISAGVAMFSWKSSSHKMSSAPTSPFGAFLLLASLFMDGVTGPLQERLVARHSPTTHQLMFWQNVCACVICTALGLVIEGRAAIAFVLHYPAVLRDIALFAVVSAVGQNFIFYTVRHFSALAVTTITTTRKMFTVLISIFVFKHSMLQRQWLGLVLVFTAIGWNSVAKSREKAAKVAQHANGTSVADGKKLN